MVTHHGPQRDKAEMIMLLLKSVFKEPPHLPIGIEFMQKIITPDMITDITREKDSKWEALFNTMFTCSPGNYLYRNPNCKGLVKQCLEILGLTCTQTKKRPYEGNRVMQWKIEEEHFQDHMRIRMAYDSSCRGLFQIADLHVPPM